MPRGLTRAAGEAQIPPPNVREQTSSYRTTDATMRPGGPMLDEASVPTTEPPELPAVTISSSTIPYRPV